MKIQQVNTLNKNMHDLAESIGNLLVDVCVCLLLFTCAVFICRAHRVRLFLLSRLISVCLAISFAVSS